MLERRPARSGRRGGVSRVAGTAAGRGLVNMPLRVRDYMTTNVVAVDARMDIMELVHVLVERDVSGALVLEADGRLAGIVTERDCIAAAVQAGYFDEFGGTVGEFMTVDVETIGPDESLMDIAERMTRVVYRRYPVVEDGLVVGVLGRRDVLRALQRGAWFTASNRSL